jgi:hypothetical protein
MKKLVRHTSLPLLVLVGLALIGPQTAEAFGLRRYVRRAYVHRPYHVVPRAVYAAPVRVYAPPVGVHVGPGVHVAAPGVRVNVGSPYSTYDGGPYYYGW